MKTRWLVNMAKFWTLFIGVGALVGAVMMWVDPTGEMWAMGPVLQMLQEKMPWPEIFFRNFVPSGFVLLAVNGLTQYVAAYLLFKGDGWAPKAVLACGVVLMLWIVLEWSIFGFYGICNAYFAFGLLESATAMMMLFEKKGMIDDGV